MKNQTTKARRNFTAEDTESAEKRTTKTQNYPQITQIHTDYTEKKTTPQRHEDTKKSKSKELTAEDTESAEKRTTKTQNYPQIAQIHTDERNTKTQIPAGCRRYEDYRTEKTTKTVKLSTDYTDSHRLYREENHTTKT